MQAKVRKLTARLQSSKKAQNRLHKTSKLIKKFFLGLFITIILSGIVYVIISPLLSIVSSSVMLHTDKSNPLVYIIPRHLTFENFSYALRFLNYKDSIIFSCLFCIGVTILQAFICSLTGYGFARFRFPGKNILFAFVVLSIVIPAQTFTVPLHIQFKYFDFFGLGSLLGLPEINLLGKPWPIVILTGIGMGLRSGLYIYIFRQFFRGMPKEIEEAAFIDGANKFYTYGRVMMPNAIPSVVTVMLFSFVWQYNDTFYTGLFMSGMSNVLSTNLAGVGGQFAYTYALENNKVWPPGNLTANVTDAAIVLTILPIIVLYLVLQKYFIEGIERSGIVG